MPKSATKPDALPISYETAMAELETLIESMERGELSLEASLEGYKRGAELVRYCQKALEQVERQVRVLDAEDGTLKPFDAQDAARS